MQGELKSFEDGRANWRALNRVNQDQAAVQRDSVTLRHAREGQNARHAPRGEWFPFKIYQVYTLGGDASDWLRYRVRAGQVLGVNATGTDGADANPDEETLDFADSAAYILAVTATPKFWFWLELGGVAPVVRYGPDPTAASYLGDWASTNPWASAPVPDGSHIPIGWVDTNTHADSQVAIIRQLLRGDVIFAGGDSCSLYG